MVLSTFVVVVLRYVFHVHLIWLQESVIYMHALVFMVGAAYTLQHDEHVRVDIFYREMSEQRRAWINLLGVLLFLLPLCVFMALQAWGFVMLSVKFGESSGESGGLPYPMPLLLKSVLLLMPAVVALQGLSMALQSLKAIRKR